MKTDSKYFTIKYRYLALVSTCYSTLLCWYFIPLQFGTTDLVTNAVHLNEEIQCHLVATRRNDNRLVFGVVGAFGSELFTGHVSLGTNSRNVSVAFQTLSWNETFLQTDRQQRSLDSFYHLRLRKGESPQSGSCKYQSGKSFIFLHWLNNQGSYSDVTTGSKVFLPETL